MKKLLFKYDESVDAIYLLISSKPWDHQVRLDDSRGINYDADNNVLGIEILSPRRRGIRLDDLPYKDEIVRALKPTGFHLYQNSPD
jgi:uncharacterized protein YuzE